MNKKSFVATLAFTATCFSMFTLSSCGPEVKKYDVTFDSKGGTAVEAQKVDEGKTVTKPTDPTKAKEGIHNYTFGYWYLDNVTVPYDFSTPVKSSFTLSAFWNVHDDVVVTSLRIAEEPSKELFIGDELDLTGLVVNKVYNDAHEEVAKTGEITIDTSAYNKDVSGGHDIVIKYNQDTKITTKYSAVVNLPATLAINPDCGYRKQFDINEQVTWKEIGLQFDVTYGKAGFRTISDAAYINKYFACDNFSTAVAGKNKVATVYFNYPGFNRSVDFTYDVNDHLPTELIIDKHCTNQTIYDTQTKSFVPTGYVIKAKFDGSEESSVYTDLDIDYSAVTKATEPGVYKITYCVKEKHSVYVQEDITVLANEICAISCPNPIEISLGDSLSLTGLVVNKEYLDGSKGTLNASEYTVDTSGFDSSTYGPKQLTVSLNAKPSITTTLTVNIAGMDEVEIGSTYNSKFAKGEVVNVKDIGLTLNVTDTKGKEYTISDGEYIASLYELTTLDTTGEGPKTCTLNAKKTYLKTVSFNYYIYDLSKEQPNTMELKTPATNSQVEFASRASYVPQGYEIEYTFASLGNRIIKEGEFTSGLTIDVSQVTGATCTKSAQITYKYGNKELNQVVDILNVTGATYKGLEQSGGTMYTKVLDLATPKAEDILGSATFNKVFDKGGVEERISYTFFDPIMDKTIVSGTQNVRISEKANPNVYIDVEVTCNSVTLSNCKLYEMTKHEGCFTSKLRGEISNKVISYRGDDSSLTPVSLNSAVYAKSAITPSKTILKATYKDVENTIAMNVEFDLDSGLIYNYDRYESGDFMVTYTDQDLAFTYTRVAKKGAIPGDLYDFIKTKGDVALDITGSEVIEKDYILTADTELFAVFGQQPVTGDEPFLGDYVSEDKELFETLSITAVGVIIEGDTENPEAYHFTGSGTTYVITFSTDMFNIVYEDDVVTLTAPEYQIVSIFTRVKE